MTAILGEDEKNGLYNSSSARTGIDSNFNEENSVKAATERAGGENVIKKIVKALKEGGLTTLANRTFCKTHLHARKYLPRKSFVFNGVKISGKLGDSYNKITWFEDKPDYEEELVKGLEKVVRKGDSVVIVGGGYGVSTVKACQLSGEKGSVKVFEGSQDRVKDCRKNLDLNGCDAELVQGLLYADKHVWGDSSSSEILTAEDIPECDVLELDCEGVEARILKDLEFQPRSIVVETHGQLGCPTKEVKPILEEKGYDILSIEVDSEENQTEIVTAEIGGVEDER